MIFPFFENHKYIKTNSTFKYPTFSQHMTKLPEAGQKRLCRNIYTVQRHLSQISGRPEAELNKALFFYELVNKDPDGLLASIMEQGASFTYQEYTYLLVI